jgi:hypothetical protein
MNQFDALTSYMAEMADIMQEVQQKMQRVKEMPKWTNSSK